MVVLLHENAFIDFFFFFCIILEKYSLVYWTFLLSLIILAIELLELV